MAQSKYFHPNYGRRRQIQSNDVERGLAAGAGIGKALQGLGGAIGGAIQQSKQDAVANQLMNAQPTAVANAQALTDPDPDPLLTGEDNLNPTAATDPSGTQDPTPYTGGLDELKLRQAVAKEALSTQNIQSEIAKRQAATALAGTKAAGLNIGGGSASRWQQGGGAQPLVKGPRGGATVKAPAYQPNSGDVQGDEGTDNFSQIASDFDNTYGTKGLYSKFATNLTNLQPDKNGNFALTDKTGDPIATIPSSDAPMWIHRTNAARIKSGLPAIDSVGGVPTVGAGNNPTSNAKPGSATNPVVAQSQVHVRSLPFGTYVYDPNTQQTFIKQKPSGQ